MSSKHNLPAEIHDHFAKANALSKKALACAKRVSWALFQMTEEERTQAVNEMPPEERAVMQMLSEDLDDQRLFDLLSGGGLEI